jgi:hypothetical protein
VTHGGFSTGQLWLTLVAEATLPIIVIGLWLVQRPRIGRLGAMSAITYAYSFVFFTGTVIYALVHGTRTFEQLGAALDPRDDDSWRCDGGRRCRFRVRGRTGRRAPGGGRA